MVLLYLLEKEFIQLKRNPIFVGVLTMYTVMVLLVFPWVINFQIKNVPISIVNKDRGDLAYRLINKIGQNPNFSIQGIYPTYEEARPDIESNRSTIILNLPDDFSESLYKGEKETQVHLLANAVDGQQSAIASGYIRSVLMDYTDELRQEKLGLTPSEIAPVEILPKYEFNPTLNYKYFMLPAFLAMMLTMFCGIFPAINIVIEKEEGTLNQINVTPIHRLRYVLSKVIPLWIIGLIITGLSILIIYYVYGLAVQGSIFSLFLSSLTFIIALSLFGSTISNVSETQQQSMFLILFFILILFLVSGLFTPIASMPDWAQVIAYSNPLTYFIKVTRMIYLKGAGFMDILPDLAVLIGFVFIFGTMATVSHKKRH